MSLSLEFIDSSITVDWHSIWHCTFSSRKREKSMFSMINELEIVLCTPRTTILIFGWSWSASGSRSVGQEKVLVSLQSSIFTTWRCWWVNRFVSRANGQTASHLRSAIKRRLSFWIQINHECGAKCRITFRLENSLIGLCAHVHWPVTSQSYPTGQLSFDQPPHRKPLEFSISLFGLMNEPNNGAWFTDAP